MLESMRPQIQKIVDELLGKVQEAGSMDVIADLACPLPAMVTATILGVPTEQQLTQWAHDLFYVFDQPISIKDYEYLNKVALEFREYFSSLIAEREKKPKEDLLSYLIAAKNQGGKLNHDELLAICAMLFSVGQETTENLIGNSVLALLHHPDQMQKLKAQPTIINSAIEELLRYDSPVQLISRLAIEDVEIGGETIRAGDRVDLCLGAANRDPAQFPDPDRLDLTRQHYSLPFGAGIHYCLGATQARIQGQIAINAIVQRLCDLKLNTNKLEWRKNIVLRGLAALPVTFSCQ
ncbi:cytochrome P450 like protein [Kalymmatonema gypsitolerans NIES-4073]|nr:cytochrome P450 like protein [Scytonema sp. NIES-4073]